MSEPATKRQTQLPSFSLIRTAKGYRVQLEKDATKQYDVSVENDRIVCTCADFVKHKKDANYKCNHVVAALDAYHKEQEQDERDQAASDSDDNDSQESNDQALASQQTTATKTIVPQMCIKRSISPDLRINCLSIKIEFPLANRSSDEIKKQAATALKLQQDIMTEYFPEAQAAPTMQIVPVQPQQIAQAVPTAQSSIPVPARFTSIGVMNGKWGPRHFITVDLGGKTAKIFGSQKQLSEHIQAAGYTIPAEQVKEGVQLNIPCRALTQPSADGRYLNIDKVFPAQ